jgi:hypothetical protein
VTQPFGVQPEALAIGDAQVDAPEWFLKFFRSALADVLFNVPDKTVTWLTDQVALRGFGVPIGQVIGFTQFKPLVATVDTQESRSSATYGDLTTAGPTLSGLADGRYFVLWGSTLRNTTASAVAQQALFVNGTQQGDAVQAGAVSEFFSVFKFADVTLNTGGNNTLTTKYRQQGGGTADFYARGLAAIRYDNI